jgi:hypothetical protein
MKVLKTVAATGIVIAAVVVLALEPASGAPSKRNVAECRYVFAGHGDSHWRSESNVAGPVGVRKWPLRDMSRMPNGDLVSKSPLLVEGHAPVTVRVPEALRGRVFLYYGNGPGGKPTISYGNSNGFSSIEFRPCQDRPRTIWAGGFRVRGEGSVHLVVEAGGQSTVLHLGRPRLYQPKP